MGLVRHFMYMYLDLTTDRKKQLQRSKLEVKKAAEVL